MPRRTATPATPAPAPPLPPAPRDLALIAQSDPECAANIHVLRRHWKWANFSQFFYTFAPLLAMPDVFLVDVEEDLARGTNLYLPRIMHRLLYVLSQDRKLSIDNWQTSLRRQYLRRAPAANPIGPEPKLPSRGSSPASSEDENQGDNEDPATSEPPSNQPQELGDEVDGAVAERGDPAEGTSAPASGESSLDPKVEPKDEDDPMTNGTEVPAAKADEEDGEEESKDWLDLPMLEKLDSMHLLTEWQFQNPYKVRQLMKDDDDIADWRIEPIGYDAKANAYWLIGPDRLWIQRVPPKPPRNRNLKRKRPSAPKKAKTPELEDEDEDEDEPVAPSKRTRTQSRASRSHPQPQSTSTGRRRAARRSTRPSAPSNDEDENDDGNSTSSPRKSTRAAKVRANKKLDLQAKELAEFQRQAAVLARSSPRKPSGSPAKRAVGTRASARLRHAGGGADEGADEEWQQVPDEWLEEAAPVQRRTRARTRSSVGRPRPLRPESEEEEGEEEEEGSETGADKAEGDVEGTEQAGDAGEAAEDAGLLHKAGLESGSVSDLTDLSGEEEEEEEPEKPARASRRRNTRTRASGRRKSARQTRRTRAHAQTQSKTASKKGKAAASPPPASDADPEEDPEEQDAGEPPVPPVPEDFVEWEAIAVTLAEWEAVAEPFARATHYLEKALYKMLTQNIMPAVIEDLQEAEKKKRMEEAISSRKRSSRIAHKENEKEEARIAARKKAEEEDKLSRSRRMEARQKKEDNERVKQDRARQQRAKEREDREERARKKAERTERAARDEDATTRSTATPSVTGTHPSSSLQPSRVVTPNGVRTPDWMLDCEICHKHGLNMDDGQAMVSCGSCNRWQHIKCHDAFDHRNHRPRRDWDKQQFFCIRCRQKYQNGSAYSSQSRTGYAPNQQPYWSQTPRPVQKAPSMDGYPAGSDLRYSHRSPMENGHGYAQQQYMSGSSSAPYARSAYPSNTGLSSMNQYHAEQNGLGYRSVPHHPQWTNGSSNGFAATPTPPLVGRTSSGLIAAQYPNGYSSGQSTPSYPVRVEMDSRSSSSMMYGGESAAGLSSARWPASTQNGYPASAQGSVHDAAQSLAMMQDAGGHRYNGASWSHQPSYGHGQLPAPTHHSPAYVSPPPPPVGVDPLTGQPFARVEHAPTPSTNGGSFGFPS
ncbi:uncharacterized protein BXZ73DRAFT_46246 [Epithele typhae]|uniref:uncharacterized protein n=1 Tax=Epithele typhae TaxID=378194 RepID=UPI002008431A|nr:uncharacterized protein BXZ73DRAFT_46246 [Epithele typhae]KAH9933667.1 hypothetical protein BXZ73DRAFT_46246 [Epithele typhae]